MNQHTIPFNWRKLFFISASFLLALAVTVGCKKKINTLGSSALDPEALLSSGGVDTFTLETYTYLEDSIRSSSISTVLLGSYNDPKLGVFNASFYTQLRSPNLSLLPTDDIVVDSVVLSLEFDKVAPYGKVQSQTYEVYRVTDTMSIYSIYYQFQDKHTDNINLIDPAKASVKPNYTANVVAFPGDTAEPQLRLNLLNSLGDQLMTDAKNGNVGFANDANFREYFKGLKVKVADGNPGSGQGGVHTLDITDSDSRMTIYYRRLNDPEPVNYRAIFLVGAPSVSARFTHVDTDISGTALESVLNDPLNGRQEFYMQSFNCRAAIKIPGLDALPKNCIVQDAVIVLPIAEHVASPLYAPTNIWVSRQTSKSSQISYFQGTGALVPAYKRYEIDIRSYVQLVVTGEWENDGISFLPPTFRSSPERIVFNGQNTLNKNKPKLIVKYTQYQ